VVVVVVVVVVVCCVVAAGVAVRQADYGKYYRINVGSEAVNHTLNPGITLVPDQDETQPARTKAFLYGADNAGVNSASRKIVCIRRRQEGGYNTWSLRFAQNWLFFWDPDVGIFSTTEDVPFGITRGRAIAPVGEGRTWRTTAMSLERAAAMYTTTNERGHVIADWNPEDMDTRTVGLAYDNVREEMTIWANFYWGAADSYGDITVTTAQQVVNAINMSGFNDQWEALLCDDQGRVGKSTDLDGNEIAAYRYVWKLKASIFNSLRLRVVTIVLPSTYVITFRVKIILPTTRRYPEPHRPQTPSFGVPA